MDFYGYNAAQFAPDFSWIGTLGKDLSKIPEAVAYEQEMKAGKIKNQDIYTGLNDIVNGMDDERFKEAFGKDKQTFLRLAQYGKTEDPVMYTGRVDKLLSEGYKQYSALENMQKAIGDINARFGQGETYQGELAKANAEDPNLVGPPRAAVLGEPPKPVTPQEVSAIGQKYGVTSDKLAPQVAQANEQTARQQIATYKPGMTQSQFQSGLGGQQMAPATTEFNKTLVSDTNAAKIDRQKKMDEQLANYRAEKLRIDAWRAAISQNKLTSDERLKIMNSKSENDVERIKLEVQIKKMENDIKSKAGKTDPNTFAPIMSQEEVNNSLNELTQLKNTLSILEEFRSEYDGLIKEKGGIKPNGKTTQPTGSGIKSEFEAWKRGR